MSVYLYNAIDVSKIKFSKNVYKRKKDILVGGEVLKKSVYYIDISYKGGPLYLQFPRAQLMTFAMEHCQAQFEVTCDIVSDFIEPLQEHIIKSVHKHSETFFKGKRFTFNKIRSCILSCVTYIESTPCINVTISDKLKTFNGQKGEVSAQQVVSELPIDCIPLVKLTNLQFIDNRFTYNLSLEQLKVFVNEPLHNYSIIDNSSTEIKTEISRDDEYYKDSKEIDSVNGHFF
ncbi:hypothetical protein EB118_03605 [bacterium]|nr:hypothetical protein [bacterium]NDC94066.1 hypothetical protein [bacterium]NDD82752.1 hypothetical protein [bacterium]NDG29172.1 hypothetical protein [bacterium]